MWRLPNERPTSWPDNDSAEGGGDNCVAIKLAHFIRKPSTHLCGDPGMFKKQRALEILAAVQTRAQNEVAVQQGSGLAEKCKQIFTHFLGARSLASLGFGDLPSCLGVARGIHSSENATPHWRLTQTPYIHRPLVTLPRCIIRRLIGLRRGGNYLDFHVSSPRQRGNLDG